MLEKAAAIAAGTFIFLAGCGGGGGGGAGPSTNASTTNSPEVRTYLENLAQRGITIPLELGDERALIIRNAEEQIDLKGPKTDQGGIVDVAGIDHTTEDGGRTQVEYLNETDRRIQVGANTEVLLQRQRNGEYIIQFKDRASGTLFATNLKNGQQAQQANLGALSKHAGSLKSSHGSSSNANQIPINIRTTSCGQALDAPSSVGVLLNDGTGKFLGSYSAKKVGAGQYVAYVPDTAKLGSVSMDTVKTAISAADRAADIACQIDQQSPLAGPAACTFVAAAIAGSTAFAGTPVAAQFLVGCEAAVAAGRLACRVRDAVNLPIPDYVDPASAELVPGLTDILERVVPDSIFNSKVTPYIVALPSNVSGESVRITAGTTSVNATIENATLDVGDVVLAPPNPAAGVGYTATAGLRCIPFQSSATMSVSGTDGYVDSTSQSWTQNTGQASLTLSVPGAESGIRDSITLSVTPRVGSPVTRTSYLVFQ